MMKKLLVLLALGSPAWASFPTGATHCWLMNESTGSTRVDSIGSNNMTDYNGNVGNAVGVFGTAANFNGTLSQDLILGSAVSLPASSSISFWYNYTTYSPAHGNNNYFTSASGTYVLPPSASYIYFYNDTSQWDYWGGQSFANNTTYHIVFTIDASYNVIAYVNGVSQGTLSNWTGGASFINWGSTGTSYYSSYGWFQNVATWNRVLNSTEVSAIYNGGAGTSCTGGGGGGSTASNTRQITISVEGE